MDTKIIQVSKSVKWIGVLDKAITTFDIVMETRYGTTYNAYYIDAEKKAVVETVKESFWSTYEAKLRSLCDPSEIKYIIVNHTEPDHAGSLRNLLSIAPNAVVVGSTSALRFLKDQVGFDFPQQAVKENDILDLGDNSVHFISAPNLHWPDTIYSYLEQDAVLFSCDSFGAHYCLDAMTDDHIDNYENYQSALRYYFDVILKPFSRFYIKAINKIRPLAIRAICPGHGPILTSHWKEIVDKSEIFCNEYIDHYPEKNRILLAYVSAYGYTKKIAEKIKEGIDSVEGITVDFCDIEKMDAATLSDKIAKASAILLGSPTINQNMLPQMYTVFALMSPLRDKDKLAGCFGSYGWSGEAEKDIITNIENLKMNYCNDSLFLKFRPQENDYERIINYGKKFALLVRGEH